jgi:Fe-S-cluster containining protein
MSPCRTCSAKCCQYFALQIDTPRTREDFESLRWYIAHKQTNIFFEKRKWYLEVTTACRFLTKDRRCKIYHKRPKICREHSTVSCEHTAGEAEHEIYLRSFEELDDYIHTRFSKRKAPRKKKSKV